MKRVIYKYELDPSKIDGVQEIMVNGLDLPRAFAVQGHALVLWVEHDAEPDPAKRASKYVLRFTGQPFEFKEDEYYIGTAQLGGYIYHLYGVMDLTEDDDE